MAHNSHSFLLALLIFNVLLAITGKAAAGREIPTNSIDKKQPQWFLDPDGSLLIPGIGRVMVPSLGRTPSYTPYGGTGGLGGSGGSYIPGGDDTFVPNPGFEVPNAVGGGGNIPAAARP